MEYLIVAGAAVALVLIVKSSLDTSVTGRALPVLVLAFIARLIAHLVVIRGGILDYGGDNIYYELKALEIVDYWQREGFQYVTSDQISGLSAVTVPCQVFALVVYLCQGPAPLACTAVVALLACGLCVVLYRIARLIGVDERAAFKLLVLTAFMPAFLVHTSDMFKDGFNAFLVLACLGLGLSCVKRFDVRKLVALGPLLWALWHVRPYMVFMCAVPLVLGVLIARRGMSVPAAGIVAVLLLAAPAFFLTPLETMQAQLEYGQSAAIRNANALANSGIHFADGGSAWESLHVKVLYTLLAPFPWTPGSLTLQLGKIDVLLWYYVLYSAGRGLPRLWRQDRRTTLVLLLFIIPSTVVYATSMANIGLIFRQRMPIVMVVSLLAALAWTRSLAQQNRSAGTPQAVADTSPTIGVT
ncbi:hypothetical protein [Nonomuraea sp. NPDC005501]|uniref:hypothetical protein n=1 Tax=Nonomuraea sp. NPDC005501 TaxID=3156884 RepID=UPI0033BE02F9